jgi:hypothetical protein
VGYRRRDGVQQSPGQDAYRLKPIRAAARGSRTDGSETGPRLRFASPELSVSR